MPDRRRGPLADHSRQALALPPRRLLANRHRTGALPGSTLAGIAACLGALLLLSLPGVAGAQAERFKDKEAAAAAGDPAGTGAARPAPAKATLGGKLLSLEDIKARTGTLRCITEAPESGGTTRCYDSADEMLAAAKAPNAKTRTVGAASARNGLQARAAACGFYEIQIHWVWGSFNNDSYGFEGRTYWQNLPSYMNNNTSSYTMGDRPGHMSEYADGNGYWYPGDTSVCAQKSITYGPYPHWDNRISSGWRTL